MSEIVRTPWLWRSWDDLYWGLTDSVSLGGWRWRFCHCLLRRFWDIPETAKEIRFIAYDKPGRWRQRVEFDQSPLLGWMRRDEVWVESVDSREVSSTIIGRPGKLKRCRGRTLYVECEYRD
jgi:hypothetical protein